MALYEILSQKQGKVEVYNEVENIIENIDGTHLMLRFTSDNSASEEQEYRFPTQNEQELSTKLTETLNHFNSTVPTPN